MASALTARLDGLGSALDGVSLVLSSFAEALRAATAGLRSRLAQAPALQPAAPVSAEVPQMAPDLGGLDRVRQALRAFADGLKAATASLRGVRGPAGAGPAPAGTAAPQAAGKAAPAGDPLSGLTAALTPLKVAAGAAAASLLLLPALAKPFVEAFDPAVVEIFSQALRDLMATVGQALQPIFTVFTNVLRRVADIIAPMFEQLRPVIEQLATMFAEVLVVQVRTLVEVFKALMPVIELLLPVIRVLAELLSAASLILRAWVAAFTGIVEAVLAALGIQMGGFADAMARVRTVIQDATRAFILLTARVLKLFGFDTAVKRMQEAFAPSTGTRKTAAPTDFGISNIEQILADAQLAAAAAGGAADTRTIEDHLAGIGDQIGEIGRSGTTLVKLLEGIGRTVQDRFTDTLEWLRGLPASIGDALSARLGALVPGFMRRG